MNHTKGKWEVKKNFIVDNEDIVIADCCGKHSAKHIVHCVNNFEPMLNMMKKISFYGAYLLPRVKKELDQAIKDAKEEV